MISGFEYLTTHYLSEVPLYAREYTVAESI